MLDATIGDVLTRLTSFEINQVLDKIRTESAGLAKTRTAASANAATASWVSLREESERIENELRYDWSVIDVVHACHD